MPINPIVFPAQPEILRPDIMKPAAEAVGKAGASVIERAKIVQNQRVALIVAGVLYPRPSEGNILDPKKHRAYTQLALNLKTHLLNKGRVDRVVVFDFLLGRELTFENGGPKNGVLKQPSRDPIRVKNYRFYDEKSKSTRADDTITLKKVPSKPRKLYYTGIDEFALQQHGSETADVLNKDYVPWTGATENSLSVQDVYERVHSGVAGRVREVHFIGHGWIGGPIIVNTPDYHSKKYDKDGRANDFTHNSLRHVFDSTNLPVFRANLTSDAFFTVWGCDNHYGARKLLITAWAKQKRGESIETEINGLKAILARTYAANLAKASDREVFAALPGTYAVHEHEKNDDPSTYPITPTVMHVNLTKCIRMLRFYKKHLGVTFPTTGIFKGHPTFGRGYARYKP